MNWTEVSSLRGCHVAFVPLAAGHSAPLSEAVRDGKPWKLWHTTVPSPETMAGKIARRLAAASRRFDAALQGARRRGNPGGHDTTYMNIDAADHRVEIASTWYASAASSARR
jgi:hypothetical protein